MKKRLTIAGVIFDMDGLMFDTERLALISWQKAAKKFGFTLPGKLLIEVVGLNVEDTRKILEREIGRKLPFDQLRALRLRYNREAILEKGVPVKEGLYDILDLLEKNSIPKAVATTTEYSIMEELLSLSRLLHRFDCLFDYRRVIWVKIRCGLIQKQKLWFKNQRPCQRHSLLLPV